MKKAAKKGGSSKRLVELAPSAQRPTTMPDSVSRARTPDVESYSYSSRQRNNLKRGRGKGAY